MVQRYEQMRRLQWYKRGAAYIPHDKNWLFLGDNRGYVYICTIR